MFKVCEAADLQSLDAIRCETDLVALTALARALQFNRFKERYEHAAIERGRAELGKLLGGEAKNKLAAARGRAATRRDSIRPWRKI